MTFVRRVTMPDLGEVIALARRFHAESPLHAQYDFDADKVADLVRGAMQSPDWLGLVAIDAGRIIGLGLFFVAEMYFGRDREVSDLAFYVEPGSRGGRAAFGMIEQLCSWAVDVRASRVTIALHTGINHERALSFLTKCGFIPSGVMLQR